MGMMRSRRPRSGRRKIVMVVLGLLMIGAGLFVFRYATEIANQVGGFISPPPAGGSNITGLGFSEGYLPFLIYGFGFTFLGIGGAMLRSAFMSSMMGAGGGMAGAGMPSPDMLNAYMQQAMTTTRGAGASPGTETPAKEIVRIKCRNCGSLEAEDAAFCRKCGQAL